MLLLLCGVMCCSVLCDVLCDCVLFRTCVSSVCCVVLGLVLCCCGLFVPLLFSFLMCGVDVCDVCVLCCCV